jgi:ribosomal protein S18
MPRQFRRKKFCRFTGRHQRDDYKDPGSTEAVHHRNGKIAAEHHRHSARYQRQLAVAIKRPGIWRYAIPTRISDGSIMNVILLERIVNLGDLGEEAIVKSGFARNFDRKAAVRASKDNRAVFEARRAELKRASGTPG